MEYLGYEIGVKFVVWHRTVTTLGTTYSQSIRNRRSLEQALMLPAVLWIGFFLGVPLFRIFLLSVWGSGAFSLHEYAKAFSDATFYRTLFVTLKISFLTTIGCLILAYPVAHLIANASRRMADLLSLIVMLTFWTSLLVRTYAWMVILGQRGLINQTLMHFGLISKPLPLMYNTTGVVIGMTHALLPFMIFSILTSMKAIDQRLLIAASGLGASKAKVFLHVYLPLTYAGIISGSLIVFLMSLGYFITPALLGGRSDMMLGQLIEFHVSETLNWPYASALSVILFALILCFVAAYVRVSNHRTS